MGNYFLEYTQGIRRVRLELLITQNVDYSAPQGIIQYESVGSNGGTTINTGRKSKVINLSGRLVHRKVQFGNRVFISEDFNDIKDEIETLKENGTIVTLIMPLSTNDVSKYIISDFGGTLSSPSFFSFNLQLTEYRQSNTKQRIINLIAVGPREQLINALTARAQGA